jgi:hypothetical protein
MSAGLLDEKDYPPSFGMVDLLTKTNRWRRMKSISFLIGSGFSEPAELPTTSRMNERLKRINADEICIHTSGDAWFLCGESDPNAHWMQVKKRRFVQEFLEFYDSTVLGPGETFHYEVFYDYYTHFLYGGEYSKELADFLQGFLKRHELRTDEYDLLFQFNFTFNQLVANLVGKRFPRVHLCEPYHPNYRAFLYLVQKLAETNVVHIHSLNHDLYIEHLALSDSIRGELDDGFEELGSPYYGELHLSDERYVARLPRFANKFQQRFRLYKLHGSIDHYWFQDNDRLELIKLRKRVGKTDVFKEVQREGKLQYGWNPLNYHPDFLCGTTAKTERYGRGIYYPTVLGHFEENLRSSDNLIVIGYSFGDQRINEYIKTAFFTQQDKEMFIVDIREPQTGFLGGENVCRYVKGGVKDMDIGFILDKVK